MQAMITQTASEYPFLFLHKERYSLDQALDLAAEIYMESMDETKPEEFLPLGTIASMVMDLFIQESRARIVLEGEHSDENDLFRSADQLLEAYDMMVEPQKMSLGDFLEWSSQHFSMMSVNQTYLKNFHHDLRYAFKLLGLSFYDMEYAASMFHYYRKEGSPPLSHYVVNAPIKEVW
jgi:hypothetical protein